MQSSASTVAQYLTDLPDDRKEAIGKLRKVIVKNLPPGFEEGMSCGMIGYYVPHSIYPRGYHCNPKQPLPFINLSSQKNAISFYHMGLYGSPKLLQWFQSEYALAGAGKPDMGKSCVRFKKPENIPYKLIGDLCTKITVAEWIAFCEKAVKR
jgi:Domain of unknown function (DU1801)